MNLGANKSRESRNSTQQHTQPQKTLKANQQKQSSAVARGLNVARSAITQTKAGPHVLPECPCCFCHPRGNPSFFELLKGVAAIVAAGRRLLLQQLQHQ